MATVNQVLEALEADLHAVEVECREVALKLREYRSKIESLEDLAKVREEKKHLLQRTIAQVQRIDEVPAPPTLGLSPGHSVLQVGAGGSILNGFGSTLAGLTGKGTSSILSGSNLGERFRLRPGPDPPASEPEKPRGRQRATKAMARARITTLKETLLELGGSGRTADIVRRAVEKHPDEVPKFTESSASDMLRRYDGQFESPEKGVWRLKDAGTRVEESQ